MVYQIRDITIIVDYGHNGPAFQRIAEFARTLRPRRLTGVIGVPGDRRNDQIIQAGEVAGAKFDEVYIREDKDLRGRAPGETAKLLYTGVRRAGLHPGKVHIIPDIIDAFKESLQEAKPGDVVVVFYEELEPVLDYLRSVERRDKKYAVKTALGRSNG